MFERPVMVNAVIYSFEVRPQAFHSVSMDAIAGIFFNAVFLFLWSWYSDVRAEYTGYSSAYICAFGLMFALTIFSISSAVAVCDEKARY